MTRGEAYDRMNALLDEVQVELMARNWDDERHDRIERGAKLRQNLTDAIFAYAKARSEEESWVR